MRRLIRRGGFSLVELLVVIGIIVVLAGLTAMFYAPFSKSYAVSSCLDRVQQTLLIAKQTARRDGQPCGVRFLIEFPIAGDTNTRICRELVYVRQRDDFAQGVYIGRVETAPHNLARVFSTANLLDPSIFPIQAGDYFELYGGGVLRRVVSPLNTMGVPQPPVSPDLDPMGNVLPNHYRIHLAPPPAAAPPPPPPYSHPIDYTGVALPASPASYRIDGPTNYRIIPQPHPQDSEPTVRLPDSTAIDFSSIPPSSPGPGWDTTLPGNVLSNPPVRGAFTEIIFGPSGAVVGQGTTSGLIYLWVREARVDGAQLVPVNSGVGGQKVGRSKIVSIQPRTGFIASHPAKASGDPYQFARDGKASGM